MLAWAAALIELSVKRGIRLTILADKCIEISNWEGRTEAFVPEGLSKIITEFDKTIASQREFKSTKNQLDKLREGSFN